MSTLSVGATCLSIRVFLGPQTWIRNVHVFYVLWGTYVPKKSNRRNTKTRNTYVTLTQHKRFTKNSCTLVKYRSFALDKA